MSQKSSKSDVDDVFIVLSSSNKTLYSFSVELGRNISEGTSLIKVMKVDYECIAYDLLSICYGIHDGFISENVGELPAFFLPVKETVNYKEYISCKSSVIGHIKYCLLFTLELLKKEKEIPLDMIEKIRRESIGNFRLSRPISL